MLTVFGSVMMTMAAYAKRLPVGAESVLAEHFSLLPGGRGANQALAAHRAGYKARLAGTIGRDAFADVVTSSLREHNFDISHIIRTPLVTGVAMVTIDSEGQTQRTFALGSNGAVTIDDMPEAWFDPWTYLLLQTDMRAETVTEAIRKIKQASGKCILHASPLIPLPESILDAIDYLILGENEAIELAASFAMRTENARAIAFDISARRNGPVIILTESNGVYIGYGTTVEHIPLPATQVIDPLGADDAFVGVFAGALSVGTPIADALHLGLAAASLTASRDGLQNAFPNADEIAHLSKNWPLQDPIAASPRISIRKKPLSITS